MLIVSAFCSVETMLHLPEEACLPWELRPLNQQSCWEFYFRKYFGNEFSVCYIRFYLCFFLTYSVSFISLLNLLGVQWLVKLYGFQVTVL